jgi:hypothetical protein
LFCVPGAPLNARPAAGQVIAYSPLMQGILVGSYKTVDEVCLARPHKWLLCVLRGVARIRVCALIMARTEAVTEIPLHFYSKFLCARPNGKPTDRPAGAGAGDAGALAPLRWQAPQLSPRRGGLRGAADAGAQD